MYDMGIRTDSPYRKSARIVGEVLGKYRPHRRPVNIKIHGTHGPGFLIRTLLVDGQDYSESVDGDPRLPCVIPREARLAAPAFELLADIGKDTVDYNPTISMRTLTRADRSPVRSSQICWSTVPPGSR